MIGPKKINAREKAKIAEHAKVIEAELKPLEDRASELAAKMSAPTDEHIGIARACIDNAGIADKIAIEKREPSFSRYTKDISITVPRMGLYVPHPLAGMALMDLADVPPPVLNALLTDSQGAMLSELATEHHIAVEPLLKERARLIEELKAPYGKLVELTMVHSPFRQKGNKDMLVLDIVDPDHENLINAIMDLRKGLSPDVSETCLDSHVVDCPDCLPQIVGYLKSAAKKTKANYYFVSNPSVRVYGIDMLRHVRKRLGEIYDATHPGMVQEREEYIRKRDESARQAAESIGGAIMGFIRSVTGQSPESESAGEVMYTSPDVGAADIPKSTLDGLSRAFSQISPDHEMDPDVKKTLN